VRRRKRGKEERAREGRRRKRERMTSKLACTSTLAREPTLQLVYHRRAACIPLKEWDHTGSWQQEFIMSTKCSPSVRG
jgi:bisphosphoglycerate-dependent phosphoglycerate mutase